MSAEKIHIAAPLSAEEIIRVLKIPKKVVKEADSIVLKLSQKKKVTKRG